MKLRLFHDSVRLRLSQSEVGQLKQHKRVEERLTFPGGRTLIYSVEAGQAVAAEFEGERISVVLPEGEIQRWAEGPEPGIAGVSGALKILVEKDFECLHGPEEENADAFPNPRFSETS